MSVTMMSNVSHREFQTFMKDGMSFFDDSSKHYENSFQQNVEKKAWGDIMFEQDQQQQPQPHPEVKDVKKRKNEAKKKNEA